MRASTLTGRSTAGKPVLATALAVAMAVAVSACGASTDDATKSSNSGDDKDAYGVSFITGLTGVLSTSSTSIRDGAQAAVDEINKKGGIDGHKIEFNALDDKSDPTQAVTLLQQAISDGPPTMVMAGVSSNEALAMMPVLTREKITSMTVASAAALDDPKQYPYSFGMVVNQPRLQDVVAAYLKKEGAKKVAVVIPNDAQGDSISGALSANLDKAGIAHTEHRFATDAVDLTPVLQAAKADNPDHIYMDGNGEPVGRLLDARLRAGATNIPTVGGTGVSAQPLTKIATPESLDNVFPVTIPTQSYIPPDKRSDAFKTFFEAVGADKELPTPLPLYAYGWDMIQVWAAGVKDAGTADAAKVASSLESLKSDDSSPWVIWHNLYSKDAHWPTPKLDEFTFAEVTGVKDNMFQTAQN